MRRDWVTLGAVVAYSGYLSYAVVQLLESSLSQRVRLVVIAGWTLALLVSLAVVGLIATRRSERLYGALERFSRAVHALQPWLRGLIYLASVATAALLAYTDISRGLMDNNRFRYAVLFALFALATQFWPFQAPRGWPTRFLITLLAGAYVLLAGDYLNYVVNYPFSLSWSEGNRFYDYSLIFAKNLYTYGGNLTIPYFSPGRYALWGVWFLIPGLSIAFHRFWNACLWIVPPLLLGWLLARGAARQTGIRLGLALWIGLFLSQGPIYAPILLSAALILVFDRFKLWLRSLSIALASLYAGLSRWTWFGVAGAWGALLDLSSHEIDPKRPLVKRLGMALWIAAAGSLPGLLSNLSRWVTPRQNTLSLSQPLLWYRLYPNATYEPGILLGLVMAAGPLLVILAWLLVSRRWKPDWLQWTAMGGVLLVTLVAGLVASVKIGGGSNLHNLDMFLITLAWLIPLALGQARWEDGDGRDENPALPDQGWGDGNPPLHFTNWPIWVKAFIVAAVLFITWPYFSIVRPLELPPQGDVQRSLDNLRAQIAFYKTKGEVLFIDQRQLLTFGYLQGVPLVPEYEKKYMMDQAMAGNAAYFQDFYQDLTNKRFVLIITEPLFESYDDDFDPFGEENNAWVKWVSEPVLCFYKSEKTYRPVRVQLLVPREGSKDCALQQP